MPKNTQQNGDGENRAAKKRRVTANPTDLVVPSTARPSAVEIRRILPRIATDKLHDLIVKNMLVGTGPISLADLEGVPKRPVEIRMNSRSINRNGWNGLDPNLLHDIFTRLNLKDKVKCVSRICKAWNKLKERDGLFEDLSDEDGPSVNDLYGLLCWLPYVTTSLVTRIRLDSSSRSEFYRAGNVLACLSSDRKKINPTLSECEVLDLLEEIIFSGFETRASDLRRLLSNGAGPKLRSITITIDGHSKLRPDIGDWCIDPDKANQHCYYLATLMGNCNQLEVLKLPAFVLSPRGLCHSLSAIGPPGITKTALKILDLTMTMSEGVRKNEDLGMISWSDVRDLGEYCPNLEVLKLPAVLYKFGDITTLPWDANFSDMNLLPRLRECVIHRIVPFSLTPPIIFYSSDIEYFIGWLFRGMPALETFTFGHGRMWDRLDPGCPILEAQLPQIPAELENCPSSLRNLHLKGFRVPKKSSMSLYFYTDQLETISLTGCTGDPLGVLTKILPKCGAGASIKQNEDSVCLMMN